MFPMSLAGDNGTPTPFFFLEPTRARVGTVWEGASSVQHVQMGHQGRQGC